MDKKLNIKPKFSKTKKIINYLELGLAIIVIIGCVGFFISSIIFFTTQNWQDINVFYEFINRILILVVGVELAKLLITHDIYSIGDLLAFIVARKMLTPELSSLDIFLSVISFSIIFYITTKLREKKSVQLQNNDE